MSAPGQTALILGATGQVGGYLLKELLSSPHFTRVAEFGRRTTSLESLPAGSKDKLEQRKLDFENPDAAGLKNGKWDVVFITSVHFVRSYAYLTHY
jgi:oxidoreductase